ncbi:MAG: D-alanyl-D-alanine carboxypeptidase, partial [Clostridiales bacterium]|nr:D-alanyl-D-alanine carboxypeptidase [Clostridiales bacterium]
RKKKIRINSKGIAFLVFVVFGIILLVLLISKIASLFSSKPETEVTGSEPSSTYVSESIPVSTEPSSTFIDADLFEGIYSSEALIMDAETGEVLAELNGYERSYPASVTKIATILVALENIDDLNDTYTMTSDIYDTLYYMDLSTAGFEKDETVPLMELFYGAMLKSGAECCLGIANYVAGSESAFVDLMNQKAESLGLTETHFTNTTGNFNEQHYSSCYDMAVFMREGLGNDTFRDLITTSYYHVPESDVHPEGLDFYSSYFTCISYANSGDAVMLGGKTGYTSEAGQCLVSFASINGHEYILVTFGAQTSNQQDPNYSRLHTTDAALIFSRLADYINTNGL